MWLAWILAARAEVCPAASRFMEQTGFEAGFQDSFWPSFVDGMAGSAPPEMQAQVRADALGFWKPRLEASIIRWQHDVVLPLFSDAVVEHVPCKVFERAEGKPSDHKRWVAANDAAMAVMPDLLIETQPKISATLEVLMGGDILPIVKRDGQVFAQWIALGGSTVAPAPPPAP